MILFGIGSLLLLLAWIYRINAGRQEAEDGWKKVQIIFVHLFEFIVLILGFLMLNALSFDPCIGSQPSEACGAFGDIEVFFLVPVLCITTLAAGLISELLLLLSRKGSTWRRVDTFFAIYNMVPFLLALTYVSRM